jgi:hypothetical protein
LDLAIAEEAGLEKPSEQEINAEVDSEILNGFKGAIFELFFNILQHVTVASLCHKYGKLATPQQDF